MPHRFEDYRDEYEEMFRSCRIVDPGKQQEMDATIALMEKHRARYTALAEQVGVPWYFIAAVHQREASGKFTGSIRDGHRLPDGVDWEEDAAAVITEQCDGWHNWSAAGLLYRLEAYNGFGYRKQHINTPYLWSFSQHYSKGKYVERQGKSRFEPNQVDKQPGTAVILHRMLEQGLITIPGAVGAAEPKETVQPETATRAPGKPEEAEEVYVYEVEPGDTLANIAEAFGVTWEELWEANKDTVPDPSNLSVGQELVLPSTATIPPQDEEAEEEAEPEKPLATAVYSVRDNDTLPQIAQAHGISLLRLLALNPGLIRPGMELVVPALAKPKPDWVASQGDEDGPPWFKIAREEERRGVEEFSGAGQDNPRIVAYLQSTTYPDEDITDEVRWCAAFVNWCIKKAGLKGTNNAGAASWARWGKKLDHPRLGCIVVLDHHVGFYAGDAGGGRFQLLGGNQSNSVNTSPRRKNAVLAYRWPAEA
jgi:uncharacterized protein (TIGR02594 family)